MTTRIALASTAVCMAALGHYTWIAPPVAALSKGKAVTIRIHHGHKFPQGEEPLNPRQLEMWVATPSGAKVKLTPVAEEASLTAAYTPAETGPHRIAMTQDRGVSSRTPRGVKLGGRDVNPDATQSSRSLRSAVAYAGTQAAKPLGLAAELSAELVNGRWELTLSREGAPVTAGVTVEVFLAGAEAGTVIGKTGADGKLTYQPPRGSKGPAMFSAAFKAPAPAGARYDTTNLETSLYVTW